MDIGKLSTDELVALFADETEKYWILSNSLTLKDAKKKGPRKDLLQARYCIEILKIIKSRPTEERLKMKTLLNDRRPGVKLNAASKLEDIAFDEAVHALQELAQRRLAPDGTADVYGARARTELDRLATEGKISWQPGHQ